VVLHPYQYYHLYNRSNNSEIVFKSEQHYSLFLTKYVTCLETSFDTLAYCLMPTHFHFLVYVKSEDVDGARKNVGVLLSSFTTYTNLKWGRHGSLFQRHTKSRHVDDDEYLITLMNYIHQNPIRAGLAKSVEEWKFSSYRELAEIESDHGNIHPVRPRLNKELISKCFTSVDEFRKYSSEAVHAVRKGYWV
jgi:putative transposase